jgi:hypothetical protein
MFRVVTNSLAAKASLSIVNVGPTADTLASTVIRDVVSLVVFVVDVKLMVCGDSAPDPHTANPNTVPLLSRRIHSLSVLPLPEATLANTDNVTCSLVLMCGVIETSRPVRAVQVVVDIVWLTGVKPSTGSIHGAHLVGVAKISPPARHMVQDRSL